MFAVLIQPYIRNVQVFKCPSAPMGNFKDWFSGGQFRATMINLGFPTMDYEWKLADALAARCGHSMASYVQPAHQAMIYENWMTRAPHDGEDAEIWDPRSSVMVGFNDGHVKFMRQSQHRMQNPCVGSNPYGRPVIDPHWRVHTFDCGWDWNPSNSIDWP